MNKAYSTNQSDIPVVTVAMSVFNGGPYLQLAVQSIVEQTFRDWELLIFDDGSTDDAVERLLYLEDSRVIVIRDGENKGLSARLNQAIDMARGRYFARMDHDDYSHPDRLARQVAYLDAHPNVDLVATKCVTMNGVDYVTGELPFSARHEQICAQPWKGFPMPHPSWMGKSAWFQRLYYQDPAPYCCEDNELLLRAYKSSIFAAIDTPLLAYRVRNYTPLRKLWKTRKAMVGVQINYFLDQGDWRSSFLAGLVAVLRVLSDLGNQILYGIGLNNSLSGGGAMSENKLGLEWIAKLRR